MLIMALSGAAVLALVCWAALRESAPEHFPEPGSPEHSAARLRRSETFIPHMTSIRHVDEASDGHTDPTSPRPLAGMVAPQTDARHNTYADADTHEALAAVAALWNVMAQERQE